MTRSHRAAVCCAVITSGLAASLVAAERRDQIDPVLVTGERARLAELRDEIVQLEDRFYARYNELNPIRDFDVHCGKEASTGRLVRLRSCRAVYVQEAEAAEGEVAVQRRQWVQEQAGKALQGGGPPVPAGVAIEMRRPAFRQNLREVVERHPELAGLLRERAELLRHYEASRQKVFGKSSSDADGERPEP